MKKDGFLKSVVKESKKIRWPNRKEMVESTIATLVCLAFFAVFFIGTDLVISGLGALFS